MLEVINRSLTTMSLKVYGDSVTPEDAVRSLKYNYIGLPFQVAVSVFARLSITILLVRLFGVHKWFKRSVTALFAILAILSIAFIPMTFCQVTPVQALWDPFSTVTNRWQPDIWTNYAAFMQCKLNQHGLKGLEDPSLADDFHSCLYLIRRCSCCSTCFYCVEIVSHLPFFSTFPLPLGVTVTILRKSRTTSYPSSVHGTGAVGAQQDRIRHHRLGK